MTVHPRHPFHRYALPISVRIPHLLISDLHMGSGGRNDSFMGKTALLCGMVHDMPSDWCIALLGDVTEQWEDPYRAIARCRAAELGVLRAANAIEIQGNHDPRPMLTGVPALVYTIPGLIAEHGHLADPTQDGFAALASRICGVAERWGIPTARWWNKVLREGWMRKTLIGRYSDYNGESDSPYTTYARERCKWGGAHCFVFGHTQRMGCWQIGHATIINTGSWVDDRADVTVLAGHGCYQGQARDFGAIVDAVEDELDLG